MVPTKVYLVILTYLAVKGLVRDIARWLADEPAKQPHPKQPPRQGGARGSRPAPPGFWASMRRWWEPAPPPPPPGFFDRIETWWRKWTTPPPPKPQVARPKPAAKGRSWKGTSGAVAVMLVWAPAVVLAVFEPDLFERLLLLAVLSGGLLWLIGQRGGKEEGDA